MKGRWKTFCPALSVYGKSGQRVSELPRKYYLDNVHIPDSGLRERNWKANILATVEFYRLRDPEHPLFILTGRPSAPGPGRWPNSAARWRKLRSRGIDPDHLARVTRHEEGPA